MLSARPTLNFSAIAPKTTKGLLPDWPVYMPVFYFRYSIKLRNSDSPAAGTGDEPVKLMIFSNKIVSSDKV
jgi:hypothetical protein